MGAGLGLGVIGWKEVMIAVAPRTVYSHSGLVQVSDHLPNGTCRYTRGISKDKICHRLFCDPLISCCRQKSI